MNNALRTGFTLGVLTTTVAVLLAALVFLQYVDVVTPQPVAIWNQKLQRWQCIGGDRECDVYWCETFGDCDAYKERLAYEEYGFWPRHSRSDVSN